MIPFLVDHLWQSTVVALAAGLLALALRRYRASVRHAVWFAASLKFVVPFAALVAIGHELEWRAAVIEPAASNPTAEWIAVAELVTQPMAALLPTITPAADDPVALALLAGVVWLAGIMVVLGAWLMRALRLRHLVRSAMPLVESRFNGLGLEVKISSSKIEPGIVGICRPVLLLPDGILQRLSPQQLDAVIAHELCHVRRRDNLTAAVHMAIAAVFWFHPLVWWIGTRLVAERERACDEAVVAAGADPHAYAEGIIKVCRLYVESPLPCAAGVGGGATLKDRVRRLAERWAARRLSRAWRAALAVVAVGLIGAPVLIGVITGRPALAQPAVTSGPRLENVVIAEGREADGRSLAMGSALNARNQRLRPLIAAGYGVQSGQITGPDMIDSRRFTITGSAPRLPADWPTMLRALLTERFGLEVHRETQRMSVLVLGRAADGASRLPVPTPLDYSDQHLEFRERSVEVVSAPLSLVTNWLSVVFGRPVLDETGFGGDNDFTFTLNWVPSEAVSAADEAALTRALEELGLSFFEADRGVELLVVDRLTEPTGL